MGIIWLVLLLMTMCIAGLVFCPLALFIINLFPKDSIIRKAGFVPVLLMLVTSSWAIYNLSAISDYLTMAGTSDNGWTVYKTVDGVDGLYIEYVGYGLLPNNIGLYLNEYNEIESDRGDFDANSGQPFIGVESKSDPGLKSVSQRALKYGIRSKREIYRGIFRITNTLMNFDTGEVFAREIFYEFKEVKADGDWMKFSTFTTYHPYGNNRSNVLEMRKKYLQVFKPG